MAGSGIAASNSRAAANLLRKAVIEDFVPSQR
jgi:hypothetical protein